MILSEALKIFHLGTEYEVDIYINDKLAERGISDISLFPSYLKLDLEDIECRGAEYAQNPWPLFDIDLIRKD